MWERESESDPADVPWFYVGGVSDVLSRNEDEVGAAELLAGLCLATDLGRGFPLEHGLHSTLVAARLCERLHVDERIAAETYYGCLLFYVGCTADAEIAADLFEDGMLGRYFDPVIFGGPAETLGGVVRALAGPGPPHVQVGRVVRRLPRAVAGHRRHMAALCEVGRMLSDRMGVGPDVPNLFIGFTERWTDAANQGSSGGAMPCPCGSCRSLETRPTKRWSEAQPTRRES